MKYAIPTKGNKGWEDEIDHHFGKAPFFTIWNEKTSEIEVVENVGEHSGVCLPVDFLVERCNALICGGIG
ncbi:MAG: NifB/NifX family molybdenum-iron cluster-binding protein, partial [Candidatus Heimdallarchaeaceae archaeon]